jgi:DNA-binding transcriptional LysR family regulator
MMMGPAIADMTGRYPKLTIEVELSDRFVDLIEEGFDAAVRIRTHLPDSSLIAKRLCAVPRVVVATPGYFKKHGTPREPNDLKDHACLIYTLTARPGEWRFRSDGGWRGVRVNGTIEANNGQFLLAPLRCGLGIACLPQFMVEEDLSAGRLRQCLASHPVEDGSLYIVYPPNRQQTPKLRAFIEAMSRHFQDPVTKFRGSAA